METDVIATLPTCPVRSEDGVYPIVSGDTLDVFTRNAHKDDPIVSYAGNRTIVLKDP